MEVLINEGFCFLQRRCLASKVKRSKLSGLPRACGARNDKYRTILTEPWDQKTFRQYFFIFITDQLT